MRKGDSTPLAPDSERWDFFGLNHLCAKPGLAVFAAIALWAWPGGSQLGPRISWRNSLSWRALKGMFSETLKNCWIFFSVTFRWTNSDKFQDIDPPFFWDLSKWFGGPFCLDFFGFFGLQDLVSGDILQVGRIHDSMIDYDEVVHPNHSWMRKQI